MLIPILAAYEPITTPRRTPSPGSIARLYREEGDPRSAWELLEPRVAGMGVPYEAARAQVALGNPARAEEIARAAYAHYKHSLAPAAELAAVLWEAERNAEAAEVIAKFPVSRLRQGSVLPLLPRVRAHVPRQAARRGRGRVPRDGRRAARLPAALQGTIATFRDTAEPETALALGKLVDLPADACRGPHRVLQDAEADARRGRGDGLAGDGDPARAAGRGREDLLRRAMPTSSCGSSSTTPSTRAARRRGSCAPPRSRARSTRASRTARRSPPTSARTGRRRTSSSAPRWSA